MILLSDPRVAAVPSADDGDPLIDLAGIPSLRLATSTSLLRREVARRLLDAQRALPDGLRLLIIEGYRSYAVQLDIFTTYRAELRRHHPDWPASRLHRETTKFVSPVDVAPHSTGGAVDLTLCTAASEELDMGTAVDATPEASANACFTAATTISDAAKRNRKFLVDALTGAGFVNYPTEWWHWSYGDRYWALMTGATHTRYGPM